LNNASNPTKPKYPLVEEIPHDELLTLNDGSKIWYHTSIMYKEDRYQRRYCRMPAQRD
jgi:hypothetical protein